MADQPISESGGITSPVVLVTEDPSEFDIVLVQVATGSKTGEADRLVVGFQSHGRVTETSADTKLMIDERFGFSYGQRAFFEYEPHQFWIAKNRDEYITILTLIRPQQNVPGIQYH